ncbi:hypothetical protein M8J76_005741 [Diaphorina citri]|nr:hypothetical protein M8J75_004948 [Diaphorina citri]KAI5722235.1 hypothetical protein M8J76_005741 [Diaphorina citri]
MASRQTNNSSNTKYQPLTREDKDRQSKENKKKVIVKTAATAAAVAGVIFFLSFIPTANASPYCIETEDPMCFPMPDSKLTVIIGKIPFTFSKTSDTKDCNDLKRMSSSYDSWTCLSDHQSIDCDMCVTHKFEAVQKCTLFQVTNEADIKKPLVSYIEERSSGSSNGAREDGGKGPRAGWIEYRRAQFALRKPRRLILDYLEFREHIDEFLRHTTDSRCFGFRL